MTVVKLMRAGRTLLWAGAMGVVFGVSIVAAQEKPRLEVDQAMTQQKAVFLENLLTKSTAAETIGDSGDAAAQAALARARALVEEAEADLRAGDFAAADGKLDEALQLVNKETQRLSHDAAHEKHAQETYERRLKSVRTFLTAYSRVAQEKGRSAALATEIEELTKLVDEAETLAAAGKTDEARVVLDRAYLATKSSIRDLRQGDKLTRTLNFATPEEEYRYERDRNDSHFLLLDLALSENADATLPEKTAKLRAQAKELRKDAETQAAGGDHLQAIDTLVRSTEVLLKAIRMAGIFVPGG